MESIQANLIHIRYRNPERSWMVAQMSLPNNKDSFVATGDIPYSETEELVQLYGEWIEDAKYGKQFKVSLSHRVLPSSLNGIKNYLANSEDIRGIGPARANKLAEYFGCSLIHVLDNEPESLQKCPGITSDLASSIARGWKLDSSTRQLSIYLATHGINPRYAPRILKRWDAETAVSKITNNPYTLTEIEGIGFITADEIAKSLKYVNDSPERIEAACIHALKEAVQEGSTFLHEGELISTVVKLTHPRFKTAEAMTKAETSAKEALQRVLGRKEAMVEEVSDGILTLKLIYLPWLYRAEKKLAERISEINEQKHKTPKNLERILKNVQERQHIDFSTKQIEAVRGAFSNNTLVITGGPGTGKTTCVKAICECAEELGLKLALAAPTGRAAKRLSEVTGRSATTIHRLLKWRDKEPFYNAGNRLEFDVLIIDESSMLDLDLACKLFDAANGSVILIGDTDQLPAIGAGATLQDIITSHSVPVIILDTIFRQAEKSLIIRNSHLIKKGEMPRFPESKGVKENSYVMWVPANTKEEGGKDDAEWLAKTLSQLVSINIPEKFSKEGKKIDPIKDIQVLAPMKKNSLGTNELNRILQDALNPAGEKFIAGRKEFRIGDRVMQMRNNYDEGMDIYNGDIGFIISHSGEEKSIEIDFYGRKILYPYEYVGDDLQLAYAQTIHKSQGSEYPIVLVIMAYQHWPMLERNLLYTANTRAKDLCLFLASKGAIERAVKNNPVKERNTYLAQRLRAYMSETTDA